MTPTTLTIESGSVFKEQVMQIQLEVVNEIKKVAREKIGQLKGEALINEAIQIVGGGFTAFQNQLSLTYNAAPWNDLAKMMINSLKNTYFYNNVHLLGEVKKILSGEEGRYE